MREVAMVVAAFAAGLGVGLFVREAPQDRAETVRKTVSGIPAATESLPSMIERLLFDAPERGNGVVTGHVRRPDGTPIRGVLIVASPRPDRSARKKRTTKARPEEPNIMDIVQRERRLRAGRRDARTLADGSYRVDGLGAGSYSLWPYADGIAFSTSQRSQVRAGESVDFEGEWFARVETAIEVTGSGPPAHAFVRVVRRQGGTMSVDKQIWNPGQPWIELQAGMIELTAILDDDLGARSEVQTIVLRVRLLDPDGEPVSRVTWNVAQEKDGSESSSSGVESLRAADGVHYVPLMGGDEYAGGRSTIEAISPKWGSIRAEFDPVSGQVIELRFRRAAEVTGVLRGYAGSGYEGRIRYQWEPPDADLTPMEFDGVGSGRIDDDGTLRMAPRQAGKQILAIYVAINADWWARVAEKEFTLTQGRQSISMQMPRLYELAVEWRGEGRPELTLLPARMEDAERIGLWQTELGKDKVGRFSGLPAGRYTLSSIAASADKQVEIEIPAHSRVSLR